MATERIDKYDLVETVGSGGMAVVYRGRDTVLQRDVAVKVMHAHLAEKEGARKRFLREARAVARLHHANIIEIYDYSGEGATRHYIVTEFVRGKNLRQFAADISLKSPEVAALVCHQLADALAHAHLNGVVHRDIKPDNVMVSDEAELKLADFGIAHVLEAENLTMTGAIVGSPAHMSPEQIEGRPSDARTDIFSLGTILYLLAAGRTPFDGDTPAALFRNIVEGRHEDPRAVNPAVDNRLARIIDRMIAPEPAARYADMGEVRRDLAAWLSDVELAEPEKELAAFFASPDAYLGLLRERLVPVLRRRAATEMAAGNTAAAMNYCNRVLAVSPDDDETLAIIRSAGRRKATMRVAAVAAATVAILAGGFFVIYLFSATSAPPLPAPVKAEATAQPTPQAALVLPPADTAGVAAIAADPPPDPAAMARMLRPVLDARKSVLKSITQKVEEMPRPLPEPRAVKIFVKPYADIYVDGTLAAKDARDYTASLRPGTHRLEFRNRFFETQETTAEVSGMDTVKDIRIELAKVKPALLRIASLPPADLYLDDVYRGSSGATVKDPLAVPMAKEKGSRTVHLRLVRKGYRTHAQDVDLQPGATREIQVTLTPEGK